jgi:hypothetical protein
MTPALAGRPLLPLRVARVPTPMIHMLVPAQMHEYVAGAFPVMLPMRTSQKWR